jgi:hypothetical protein
MKTILIIWGLALVYCIFDAIFFSELDPESKKELKDRENEYKSTS